MALKLPRCHLISLMSFTLFCGTVAVVHAQPSGAGEDIDNAFLLGITPQQSSKKTRALWQPLATYIQQQTNYPVALHCSPDIPTFENRLFTGKFDLAYVNPRLFIEANKYVGYFPLVREGQQKLKGIIVVAKSSSYQTIQDLQGAHFVSPKNAFAASVITQLNLRAQNITFKNSYVKSHTQGYSLVIQGLANAAGGVMRTFNRLAPNVKNKLRVLWESKGFTSHAFMIHRRVNKVVRQRILSAILSFKDTPEGVSFYSKLKINPFVKAANKDWDDVRQLLGR